MTDLRTAVVRLLNEVHDLRLEGNNPSLRAALADVRDALAHPEPPGEVTYEELKGVFHSNCYTDDYGTHLMDADAFTDGARAAIALDRSRRAPQVADGDRQPSGYAYRYQQFGGSVIRFNGGGEVNGSRPVEGIPYWLGRPPQPVLVADGHLQPSQDKELEHK